MDRMLIGLSGYGGSGKDAVADLLVSEFGFTRRAFADPMRDALYRLNPLVPGPGMHDERLTWLVDTFGWDSAKRQFPEVRRLLQVFGVECGRDLHGPDCWADLILNNLPAGNIVISDVRFPNEARRIKSMGGQIWRIARPGTGPVNDHGSDSALDGWKWDHIIWNGRGLTELRDLVRTALPNNTDQLAV